MQPSLPADALSRRELLAGSLALAAGSALAAETKAPAVRRPAKRVIFVLMSGAPSQFETFDPKPGAPTGGPFGTIADADPRRPLQRVPAAPGRHDRPLRRRPLGHRPGTAGGDHVADLRRTLTGHAGNSRFGVAAARLRLHRRPPARQARRRSCPATSTCRRSWHDAAFQGAGCLGASYDMMKFPGYGKLAGATAPPDGVSEDGFRAAATLRDALSQRLPRSGRQAQAARRYEESFARARGLMESTGVFDLSREPAEGPRPLRPERYGADCLTARRLLEAGVPFVLIQCFGTRCDWDWHYEAFSHLSKYMLGVFDHVTTDADRGPAGARPVGRDAADLHRRVRPHARRSAATRPTATAAGRTGARPTR